MEIYMPLNSDSLPKVLIIEDEDSLAELYQEVLKEKYNVTRYESAEQALPITPENLPHVILLDLNLPGMSGQEFCQLIKTNGDDIQTSIIVVSAEKSIETKLKVFECGADDFLAKPFELKELLHKVNSSIKRQMNYLKLQEEAEESKELAYTSMQQASQYSYVMNFFKALNQCNSTEGIVKLFFDAMSYFNLRSSIKIKIPHVQFYNPGFTDVSPIEQNIYELLESKSRLYEFGDRLMVNDTHVSFLIKKMPEDEAEAGQVRDFIAALIEGIEAKLKDLQLKAGVTSAIDELGATIVEVEQGVMEHNRVVSSVMSNMLGKIAASYHSLEMTEMQETFFSDLVESGSMEISHSEDILINIQNHLQSIVETMEQIKNESINQEQPTEEDSDSSDVELF